MNLSSTLQPGVPVWNLKFLISRTSPTCCSLCRSQLTLFTWSLTPDIFKIFSSYFPHIYLIFTSYFPDIFLVFSRHFPNIFVVHFVESVNYTYEINLSRTARDYPLLNETFESIFRELRFESCNSIRLEKRPSQKSGVILDGWNDGFLLFMPIKTNPYKIQKFKLFYSNVRASSLIIASSILSHWSTKGRIVVRWECCPGSVCVRWMLHF